MTENMETTSNLTANTKDSNWKRFSEWIHCICVVTFDLELGQAMEVIIQIYVLCLLLQRLCEIFKKKL